MRNRVGTGQLYIQTRGFKRSQEAFNAIWVMYHKPVLFFIRNMVRDDAEDLLQEIMIKVYQNLNRYKPWYSFNTWIYTIARNHCNNHLEKRKPDVHNIEKWENITGCCPLPDNPEYLLLKKEFQQNMDIALNSLSCDLRQIAFLRFYEGMKCRDIAKVMNIPNGTVKSRLHHIRLKLKKELESYYEIE